MDIRIKPLEWYEAKALGGGRKSVAQDCFGNEFARIDLTYHTAIEVEEFKAEREREYERRILSCLTTEPATPSETVITDNVSPYSYKIRSSPGTVLRCCTINGKSFCNEPRAYVVHAPEDDYCGTWPGRLQFHPLTQRDLDNGYRQTPLYTRPAEQAVTEAMVEAAREIIHGARHVYSDEDLARAALKAAMEAGRHD